MTDYQKAAIEAGAYAIDPIAMDAPQDYPASYETAMTEAGAIIAAAEPHLRKKWVAEAETLMPEMGSHINVTPYREGVADGINRVLRLLEGAGE